MDDLKLYIKNEKYSFIQVVSAFDVDIGMKFGIDEYATQRIKKAKTLHSHGIQLPDIEDMRSLKEWEIYKYIGFKHCLSLNIEMKEMKRNIFETFG